MDTKICTNCKNLVKLDNFFKDKNTKDKLQYACKTCIKKKVQNYNRTEKGLITTIYSNQKTSSKKRGHIPPNYTKEELFDWILSQDNFKNLYNNWVNSNYKKDLTPSIDRLNDNIGYSLSNIQLMTWRDNYIKAQQQAKVGDRIYTHREIEQYSKKGILINTFKSISIASRNTCIDLGNISTCCRGKAKTAGGYIWKYKNNINGK